MSATPPKPSSPIEKLRPIVPKLIDLTEKVVFGDVWRGRVSPNAIAA